MHRLTRASCLILLGALIILNGCSTSEEAAHLPAPPPPVLDAGRGNGEDSIRPGVNARFLAPDLDVEEMVQTFEAESREIAASRAAIIQSLQLESGLQVADVGAGTGLFLEPLVAAVGSLGRVYALDISPSFVDFMNERIRAAGWPGAQARLVGARSIGLPQGSVDVVFVCDTYHHFEFPQSTLASIRHALRPGGLLVVVDFERIEGQSRAWVLNHVRADKATFRAEIEAAGFTYQDEPEVDGLSENYVLRFRRP